MAARFRDFLIDWAEAAEELMARGEDVFFDGSPAMALNATLGLVEGRREDRLSTSFLGQALLLLYTHWDFGGPPDDLYGGLSPIEQHLFQDVTLVKMSELAQSAQEGAGHDAG